MSDVLPPPLPPRLPPAGSAADTSLWSATQEPTPLPPPELVFSVTPEPTAPRRRSGRRWALVAAVFVVLAVGVGALAVLAGGGEGGGTETYALGAAAEQATAATTAEFEISVSVGSLGAIAMDGAVDNEAQLMTMSMDMSELLGVDGGTMELILDVAGGVMYMRADAFGEMLPIDAEWISMDLETIAAMSGQSLDDLRGQFAVDPTAASALLVDEDDAVVIGLEEIDGESVKHYQVTVDVADALAANPQAQRQLDESGVAVDLPEDIVYDVWVTEDNQLRRMSFELPVMGETMRTQLDLRMVGEPLEIDIPSGDGVVDVTDLLGL